MGLSETDPTLGDAALTSYANAMAVQLVPSKEGDSLRAAWEARYPRYSAAGDLKLPRFRHALKGWDKLSPKARRQKVSEELTDALVANMMVHNDREAALWVSQLDQQLPSTVRKLSVEGVGRRAARRFEPKT